MRDLLGQRKYSIQLRSPFFLSRLAIKMSRFVDGNAFSVLSVDKTEGGQTPGTRKRNKQGKQAPKGKELSETVHDRELSSSKQKEAAEKVLKVSKPSKQPVQQPVKQIVGHVKQESTATKSKSVVCHRHLSERNCTSAHVAFELSASASFGKTDY